MRTYIILFCIFDLNFAFGQSKIDSQIVVSPFSVSTSNLRQKEISKYTDSINHYLGGKIPSFLLNPCFDLQRNLWLDMHSPVSLRWEVLENVTNKRAMEKIIKTKNEKLNVICQYSSTAYPEIVIPMIDKSFFELLNMRYKQIK